MLLVGWLPCNSGVNQFVVLFRDSTMKLVLSNSKCRYDQLKFGCFMLTLSSLIDGGLNSKEGWEISKINKRRGWNKNVLGGKFSENY